MPGICTLSARGREERCIHPCHPPLNQHAMLSADQVTAQILSSTAVIRFQDCDPYAHLNNGRYLDYFMNAREDQLLKMYGFNIY